MLACLMGCLGCCPPVNVGLDWANCREACQYSFASNQPQLPDLEQHYGSMVVHQATLWWPGVVDTPCSTEFQKQAPIKLSRNSRVLIRYPSLLCFDFWTENVETWPAFNLETTISEVGNEHICFLFHIHLYIDEILSLVDTQVPIADWIVLR